MHNHAAANWFRTMSDSEFFAKMINAAGRAVLKGTWPGGAQIAEAYLVVALERCGEFGCDGYEISERCKWYRREVLPAAYRLQTLYR